MDRLEHEVAEDFLGSLHDAVGARVEEVVVPVGEILREEFAEHRFVDGRRHGELDADITASLSNLADLSRHKEAAFRCRALLGKQSPAAMDDVAEVGAGPFPPGHLIGEPRENALGQRLVRRGRCIDIKSLPLGQAQELVVDAARLAGGVAVDRQLAASVGTEVVALGPAESARHDEEVGASSSEEILPLLLGLAVGPQEQWAGLGEGRHQGCLTDAAELLRGDQHAGVARMGGEGEHPVAERGDRAVVIKGAEVTEQGFGLLQGMGLGGVEPPDGVEGSESRRLQREEHLAQIDTVDLGRLTGDTPRMLPLRPEP